MLRQTHSLNPELAVLTDVANQLAPGILFLCLLCALDLWEGCHAHLTFMWALGIQILALMLRRQVLYQLSHLSSPVFIFFSF